MITEKDIIGLVSSWRPRLDKYSADRSAYSAGYKDALNECLSDVVSLTASFMPDRLPDEAVRDWACGMEADAWLASLEAHEP